MKVTTPVKTTLISIATFVTACTGPKSDVSCIDGKLTADPLVGVPAASAGIGTDPSGNQFIGTPITYAGSTRPGQILPDVMEYIPDAGRPGYGKHKNVATGQEFYGPTPQIAKK
jgi:hypothetical protein